MPDDEDPADHEEAGHVAISLRRLLPCRNPPPESPRNRDEGGCGKVGQAGLPAIAIFKRSGGSEGLCAMPGGEASPVAAVGALLREGVF